MKRVLMYILVGLLLLAPSTFAGTWPPSPKISELGTATYDNVQDWINSTQSAGRISGGDLSKHIDSITAVTVGGAGSGEFKVADDQTAGYPAAATITIYGSTNNDGDYTVSAGGSSHAGGTTTIPVDEAVATVADGDIQNGRADVTAGTGFIKITDSEIGETKTFDWSASNNIALTDLSTNHIHINYNAGSPVVQTTDDRTTIELNREFTLGMIYRNGTYTWPHTSGVNLPNSIRLTHERLLATRGFERAKGGGGEISEYGTRNIQSTAGEFYRGNNKTTTTGKASATDKMTTVYYNGSNWVWTQDETQINNTQYNNIASGLATLSNNKYSIHWVCIDYLSNLYDVFGQGDYTLTEAQVAGVPSLMPVIATDFGIVAAKIIIKKSDAAFTEVISAYTTLIPSASPATHNDLSGLDGGTAGEYYHLTSAQHTIVTQAATNAQAGYATAAQITAIEANTAKDTNVSTTLVAGTITATTYGVTSDGGIDDIVFPEANTNYAGLLGADKWDEIVANTLKETNATHTGEVTGSVALTITNKAVTLAKMNDMATASLLGRNTAGTGVPEVLPKATALSLLNVEDGADITDAVNVASSIHGVAAKATPVDADEIGLIDSAAANVLKKLTWVNVKATLKTYFDTLYNNYVLENHASNHTDGTDDIQNATTAQKGLLTDTDWDIFNNKQAALTFGIADTNKLQINSATVADNDFAKFTPTGLEGRSYSETMGDLSGSAAAEFSFNTQKIGGVVDPTTDQQAATKKYVDDHNTHYIQFRILDKNTSHTTGTGKGGEVRIPEACTVLGVGAYIDTAGTTSVCTFDINEAGSTILSTKITIDATEKSSKTAATAPVISDSALTADAIITYDIDGIASGTAGKGLVIWMKVKF